MRVYLETGRGKRSGQSPNGCSRSDPWDWDSNRDRFNALIAAGDYSNAEAAGLFYYLNRTGYNGLCRFNRSGGFNTPCGRYSRINYTTDISSYKKTFAGWMISNKYL